MKREVLKTQSASLMQKIPALTVDTYSLLGLEDHRKFQMLLGMLQWLVTICCPDLCCLVSSLNRLEACPRESHFDLVVQAFDYLKCVPNSQIANDYRPIKFKQTKLDHDAIRPEFLKDYPDAQEEMNSRFLHPFESIVDVMVAFDDED